MVRLFEITSKALLSLSRPVKRLVVISVDISLCILATWFAFYLRLGEFMSFNAFAFPALLSIMIAIPVFISLGLYRAMFRYVDWSAIQAIGFAMSFYTLFYLAMVVIIGFEGTPRTIGIIQPILLFFGVAGVRVVGRFWLDESHQLPILNRSLPRVIIYGAGSAGRQLVRALSSSHRMSAVCYVDDDESLHGQILNGLVIYGSDKLADLISSKGVSYVLLAMPSVSKQRRQAIIDHVSECRVIVRTLPSVSEIAEGRVTLSDLKEPDIDDLLGREVVLPNPILLSKKVTEKIVLVTGAGGSIGSELCRQVLSLRPRLLLLLDINEFALYSIHAELEATQKTGLDSEGVRFVALLGSVQDRARMREIMSTWPIETIYHAAAYKHVPLVELNVLESLNNNLFGTLQTAYAAIDYGVSDFVLISSDKAVRPTNVMGATKRLAESCLQALQAIKDSKTCFSMVRFGNVLASSGSVVPKFSRQIAEGGPVTVTHPEVTRYFMTIPEAAQLVVQAGALAKGGEVFVLDMGKPVRILELAVCLIRLSGLKEKTENQLEGDIEIKFTGLRPGEKLFEELLIGGNPEQTAHPKILKATEDFIPWSDIEPRLESLRLSISDRDVVAVYEALKALVKDFSPNSCLGDSIHIEKSCQDS